MDVIWDDVICRSPMMRVMLPIGTFSNANPPNATSFISLVVLETQKALARNKAGWFLFPQPKTLYRASSSINPLRTHERFDEQEYFAQEKKLKLQRLAMCELERNIRGGERARERESERKKERRKGGRTRDEERAYVSLTCDDFDLEP